MFSNFFQPSMYSREKNASNAEVFFDESQKISGIVVGVAGVVASASTAVVTTYCSNDVIAASLVWQALGACAISTAGSESSTVFNFFPLLLILQPFFQWFFLIHRRVNWDELIPS
jgi:hypothetical protein